MYKHYLNKISIRSLVYFHCYVCYLVGPTYHLSHGDIMMTDEEEKATYENGAQDSKLRDDVYNNGLLDTNKRWPNPVPYKVDPNLGSSSKLLH